MRNRLRAHRLRETAELNITAFMNLMVILVPFLLITAVFSRMAILEVNLPDPGDGSDDIKRSLQLEVIVRQNSLMVVDRNSGPLKSLPNTKGSYDYKGLSFFLQRIKAKFPDKLEATLLLEPNIPYDTLVQVMDAVRQVDLVVAGEVETFQLFPVIAIGDAPARARSAAVIDHGGLN
ncbi:MAG: biopolymer transporter ExbD [Gammaproteobacteria bacterium]|nr:biopolymer transporter ExbD [Gammaproteobacteria bacterium]